MIFCFTNSRGEKSETDLRRHDLTKKDLPTDCRSELWRDVSRNGIFWCPFLVLGIGYLVFGYIHIYICIHVYIYIEHCVLGYIHICTRYIVHMYIHLYIENWGWCDITWSIIMKQHMAQTNAQYQYAWWVWRYAMIWWCMVSYHETTLGPCQHSIPICQI